MTVEIFLLLLSFWDMDSGFFHGITFTCAVSNTNINCNITAISSIPISFKNKENAKALFIAILVISDLTDIRWSVFAFNLHQCIVMLIMIKITLLFIARRSSTDIIQITLSGFTLIRKSSSSHLISYRHFPS